MIEQLKNQFVSPEIAMALKGSQFSAECIGLYSTDDNIFSIIANPETCKLIAASRDICYLVPLKSQVFDWFLKNKKLEVSFDDYLMKEGSNTYIVWHFFIREIGQTEEYEAKKQEFCSNNFDTFIESPSKEEAELEAIKQLIKYL